MCMCLVEKTLMAMVFFYVFAARAAVCRKLHHSTHCFGFVLFLIDAFVWRFFERLMGFVHSVFQVPKIVLPCAT